MKFSHIVFQKFILPIFPARPVLLCSSSVWFRLQMSESDAYFAPDFSRTLFFLIIACVAFALVARIRKNSVTYVPERPSSLDSSYSSERLHLITTMQFLHCLMKSVELGSKCTCWFFLYIFPKEMIYTFALIFFSYATPVIWFRPSERFPRQAHLWNAAWSLWSTS